jgi:hypothetical protein
LQDSQQRPRQQDIRRHLWVKVHGLASSRSHCIASSIGCLPMPYHHAQGLMGIDAASDSLRTTANASITWLTSASKVVRAMCTSLIRLNG